MNRRIDKPDTPADIQLRECLSAAERRSFVMVAGAGSGKTTSLIKALSAILDLHVTSLKSRRQRVAQIHAPVDFLRDLVRSLDPLQSPPGAPPHAAGEQQNQPAPIEKIRSSDQDRQGAR